MDREGVKEVLVDAGFSSYEATVYTTLLHVGDVPVADLPEICDVPRTRAYDITRQLTQRGLVETYEEGSQRVSPVEPSALVDRFTERSEGLLGAADEIQSMWEESAAKQSSLTVLNQYEHALAKAASEFESAENLISISIRPRDLQYLESSLRGAIERGVTVRISLQDTPQTEAVEAPDGRYAEIATEVRRCESVVPFIALFDGPNAIFAIRDNFGQEYGVLVRDHFLTSIFHWFYQMQLWEAWNVLYSAASEAPDEYVSVHELIRDFRLTQTDENSITVRIKGYETNTGDHVDVTGTIIDVVQADNTASSLDVPFIQATVLVDTGEETLTVGGYGAIVEDIRSYSIQIRSVD